MVKDLQYFMGLNYPVTVEIVEDYGESYFSLEVPDLPGCGAYGPTIEEAFERLEEAKELWIEASLNRGLDISEPVSEEDYSGKFLLRIPSRLHMKLADYAKKNKVSLNQYVKSVLEQSEVADRILKYLQRSNKALLSSLEKQNRKITRLEHRIESLESSFNSRYSPQAQYCTVWSDDSVLTGTVEATGSQYDFVSSGSFYSLSDLSCSEK
jgi:predicted RNase H-like HicB family nuclease